MLRVGDVVDGKFRLVEQIGAGGMSVVWQARNDRSNKLWAIKEVLRSGLASDHLAEMALMAEIDTLKHLRHDNIVAISDVLETPDSLLILMDYVEGRPLGRARTEDLQGSDTIELTDGAFPQDQVIRWAKQLAAVFAYLHGLEPPIVYRDLKPSNVMLRPNGDVVLIDFGTARRFAGGRLQSVSGASGTVALGTYGYAAPEVLMGDVNTDRADPRSDIYSLGVTLYHLVTGHNPSQPPYEMYPIRQLNSTLSGGLEKIIARCTGANPADRYQSCEELLYDLQHYQEVDDGYRRRLRRRVALFGITAGLAIVLAGGGTVCSVAAARARTSDFEQVVNRAISEPLGSSSQVDEFLRAIDLKPDDPDIYLQMLESMRSDSDEFSSWDHTVWSDLMATNRTQLQSARGWPELAHQVGLTYGFFYEGPEADAAAATAFEQAVDRGSADSATFRQDELFSQVFGFRVRAAQKLGQVDYNEYWDALEQMVESVDGASAQSDVAAFGALLLPAQVLAGYPDRFINAGESPEALEGLLAQIEAKSAGLVCLPGAVDAAVEEDCKSIAAAVANARASLERHSGSTGSSETTGTTEVAGTTGPAWTAATIGTGQTQ
ncbi:MAG: serine/threonine protein kinase [Bifidobacteriaceae bacterium]|jgi:serine/threonine-protein kinase|nr:serine/threonine protein kinase [Bifidobacteriaceae bacterium]